MTSHYINDTTAESPWDKFKNETGIERTLPPNSGDQVQIAYYRLENPWKYVYKSKDFKVFRQMADDPKDDLQWRILKNIGNLCNIGFYYVLHHVRGVFDKTDKILKKVEGIEEKVKDFEKVDLSKMYRILRVLGQKQGIDVENPPDTYVQPDFDNLITQA